MAQRMTAAHAEIVPATVTDEADIDDWRPGEDVTIRLARAIATAKQSQRLMPGTIRARENGV
jgi:2-oxoisovalerate dehydrogenase E2 component (dihydrolipoyl transacylase)